MILAKIQTVGAPLVSATESIDETPADKLMHGIMASMGKIRHRDIIYYGAHEPLVDAETWHLVQDPPAGRRIAGDRSWRHTH
jgi:hypothetical protein